MNLNIIERIKYKKTRDYNKGYRYAAGRLLRGEEPNNIKASFYHNKSMNDGMVAAVYDWISLRVAMDGVIETKIQEARVETRLELTKGN